MMIRNKKIFNFKKLVCILIIIFIVSTLMPTISMADTIMSVTDIAEKEKLLGIETENQKKTGLLGIAEKFSIFARENVTLKAADTNGRIAVGGKLEATTEYEYQVACELDEYKSSNMAQIISEKGPMKNIALEFGWNDKTEETYSIYKKVAISSDFDFDGSRKSKYDTIWHTGFSDTKKVNLYSIDQFIQANLFKFADEFEYLEEQGKKLVDLSKVEEFKSQEISQGKIIINSEGKKLDSIIFKGNNKRLNIFNLSVSEFNTLFKNKGEKRALTFDVPYGSYIVINITGEEQVDFDGSELNVYYPMSELEKDNYSEEIEDIAYIENEETAFHRISSGNNNNVEINNNANQAQYILYNVSESTKFTINSNWIGTILAPKADGIDNGLNGMNECGGHLSGILICNSYEGYEQFGYVPFSLGLIEMDIEKIEKTDKSLLPGAEMAIYYFETDKNGDIICTDNNLAYKWITTEETKNLVLPSGGYVLKELNPPAGYESQDNKYYIFETEEIIKYEVNDENYGRLSYESVIKEGHEETKETALISTANNMWKAVKKVANIMVDIFKNIKA